MAEKPEAPKAQPLEVKNPLTRPTGPEPPRAEPLLETPWRVFNHGEIAQHYTKKKEQCTGAMQFDRMQARGKRGMQLDAECSQCHKTMTLAFDTQEKALDFFLGFFERKPEAGKAGKK